MNAELRCNCAQLEVECIVLSDTFSLRDNDETWRLLSAESVTSYFISWGWCGTWLQEIPPECKVHFVEIRNQALPVSVFFLGEKKITRSKFFKINQLVLNASGHNEIGRAHV